MLLGHLLREGVGTTLVDSSGFPCRNVIPGKMDLKEVTLIKKNDLLKDDFTLKVCIITLWSFRSCMNPLEAFPMEFILVDKEDTKI
ncbi:hypothetical protein L2E82_12273 [Cichorium intybus]|uniref:Uncharacterized protein n=1 Tax=Cichorium intybus TaxID=13427 RepID=A0ACB9GFM4_CICIN|nr:hypothetical protein L2E82_12273 [Cichorium intybus]